jgi:hypothetical protein
LESDSPDPVPPVSSSKSPKRLKFPLHIGRSYDGIISFLTRKHSGNVHDKGIVTITSKSVLDDKPSNAPRNVADLTSQSGFQSQDSPDQWVCWDFHGLRVSPTEYTIKAVWLQSWMVEGSLDGQNWVEIDRQTNSLYLYQTGMALFGVAKSVESRFIRLTQTGRRLIADDCCLVVYAFEIFGTLIEGRE